MEPEAAGGQWGRGCGGDSGASAGQDQQRQHLPRRRRQAAAGRSAGTGRSGSSFGRLTGVGHAAWRGGEEPGRGPPARPPAAPSRDTPHPPSVAPGVASSRRAAERIRWKTLGFSHGAPRAAA